MELPVSFADYTRTLLGDEDYKELVTSLESEQSVSIRLQKVKTNGYQIRYSLKKNMKGSKTITLTRNQGTLLTSYMPFWRIKS